MLSGIMDYHELNPDNLPFELGLSELVALDKGCYRGKRFMRGWRVGAYLQDVWLG